MNQYKIPFVFLAILMATTTARATPQFAVRSGKSCQACHVNPTGGGMRSLHGAQIFSHMELPWKELDDFSDLENYNPQISKNFQLGVDFRTLYYTSDDPTLGNSFLTMEGTLYTTIAPSNKTLIYLAKGLYSSFEGFVLFRDLPLSSAIRAGRFTPGYGWRFPDHNSYTRSYLGFGQGRGNEDGVEIGTYQPYWEASAAVTNGSLGITDGDRGKVSTLRAARRQSIGPLKITLGGSWRYAEFNLGKGQPAAMPDKKSFGPFWGTNLGGWTYLGETDWVDAQEASFVVSHSLTYLLRQGLILSAAYDFYDPDLDAKSGVNWRGRFGAEIYPTGYLELLPGFVWEHIAGRERGTGELQLHVWF